MAWPPLDLAIVPPFPPMEARLTRDLPPGEGWQFEPKWDGFRCIAFKQGATVALQSKAGQPLGRYFPEIEAVIALLGQPRLVLDGEIVVPAPGGFSFEALLQRIHPAESRIRRLAAETPARFFAFDLLVDAAGRSLLAEPLEARRRALEEEAPRFEGRINVSPASRSRDEGEGWLAGASGLDGVVAKRLAEPYRSGERAMVKVKRERTADCVVGGFRRGKDGHEVASILLGLYADDGRLHYVGHASSFTAAERGAWTRRLEPLRGAPGFSGDAPGGPSRWARERSTEWEPVRPELVVEVAFHHASGGRFRHNTRVVRLRPDKPPQQCTFEQLAAVPGAGEAHVM